MLSALLSVALLKPQIPPDLDHYLNLKDSSFAYSAKETGPGRTEITMTSQTWHGNPWKHTILIQQPRKVTVKGTGILYITGDGPKGGDILTLGLIAESTGMPTAMLFDIPNQPIWGMKEDDLIAHTFEEYLKSGDGTWPLLFPMAKAAVRAMDAVVGATKGSDNPLKNFVVTGASKRGWTTWFVGAAQDKRVKAIAPMVIDNLNVTKQMKHQLDTWGAYSEQIQDYSRRGLQKKMFETPEGKLLGQIVDPYTYRSRIKMPTLIIKGGNDPYWTADALDQYWGDLHQPKWILTVPNAGHTLGDGMQVVETTGAFARAIAGEFTMPKQTWKFEGKNKPGEMTVRVSSQDPPFEKAYVWVNESDNLDFRETPWKKAVTGVGIVGSLSGTSYLTHATTRPRDKNLAVFVEMRYRVNGKQFSLCTPTEVYRK